MQTQDQIQPSAGAVGSSKVVIVGTIEIPQGRREQLLSLLMAHRARCLADEPGTLQFEVLAPDNDDTKLLLYEVYRDATAFEVHRKGPSIAQWREESARLAPKIYFTKCSPVPESKN